MNESRTATLEQIILAGLLTNPYKAKLWDMQLSAEDFDYIYHQEIWNALKQASLIFHSDMNVPKKLIKKAWEMLVAQLGYHDIAIEDMRSYLRELADECITPYGSYFAALQLRQIRLENQAKALLAERSAIKRLQRGGHGSG